ncbi:HD domain-containing protein [Nonomuraea sp. NPDC049725]|uniref:HD domain-containing protein n=1 Tax=Nonomuraea sp. NPDC049725 TaxID=3154508 RepID=UPI00342D5117
MDALIAPLLGSLATRLTADELRLVERAYECAAELHEGRYLYSGDSYITHLVRVASLVANTGADSVTISAAFLHSAADAQGFDLDELRAEVGAEVAGLVTKLGAMKQGGPVPADRRVQTIKVFDRLDNMRTIEHVPPHNQRRTSLRVLESSAPMARQLGLAPVAAELESLAHARLSPGRTFGAVRAASLILPRAARRRYLQEWRGELARVEKGHRTHILELLRGVPALAVVLWRVAARRLVRRLLAVAFATRLRPWAVFAPVLGWLACELVVSSPAEALAFVLTVPPACAALIARVRDWLGLD